MHIRYSTDDYEKLDGQHNIMVLVGNGFDIAVLNKFGDKKMNCILRPSAVANAF